MLKSDQGAFVLEHFSEEHLSGEHLSGEHLSREHLSREHLSGEHLSEKHLPCSQLTGENLSRGAFVLMVWGDSVQWEAFVSGSILSLQP